MSNAFTRRLAGYGLMRDDDVTLLAAGCHNTRTVPAGHHLIREGDEPDPVFVMLAGWACGYKMLPDGGRQIVSFLLPGDFCDIHIALLDKMDYSVITLTESRIALLPRSKMEALVEARPTITRAFWWSQLVDQSVLRAWIVSMGRRSSRERIAHLMCELYIRMRNIGLASDDQCHMPLTQIVLADAVGMTPVHVNRVLKHLRQEGAERMIADHTRTSASLAAFVENDGSAVTIPTELDARRQTMLQRLQQASAADFNQLYFTQQTAAHEEALNLHRSFAENGDNDEVRAVARTTTGVIEQHNEMLRSASTASSASSSATNAGGGAAASGAAQPTTARPTTSQTQSRP